jgi:hypothetical protein
MGEAQLARTFFGQYEMFELSNIIDWSFWDADKSAVARNFLLMATGLVGLIFLIWRAISTDRSARAALKQAITSSDQLKLMHRQLELATKQTNALIQQAEIASKNYEESIASRYSERFSNSVRSLCESKTPLERSAQLLIMEEISEEKYEYVNITTKTISNFLSSKYPSNPIDLKGYKTVQFTNISSQSNDLIQNAQALCNLPDVIWHEMFLVHSAKFSSPIDIKLNIQSKLDSNAVEADLDDETKFLILQLVASWLTTPPYIRNRFFYKHEFTVDKDCSMRVLERIKNKYDWAACGCTDTNLNGIYLAGANLSSFFFSNSTFRGGYLL